MPTENEKLDSNWTVIISELYKHNIVDYKTDKQIYRKIRTFRKWNFKLFLDYLKEASEIPNIVSIDRKLHKVIDTKIENGVMFYRLNMDEKIRQDTYIRENKLLVLNDRIIGYHKKENKLLRYLRDGSIAIIGTCAGFGMYKMENINKKSLEYINKPTINHNKPTNTDTGNADKNKIDSFFKKYLHNK